MSDEIQHTIQHTLGRIEEAIEHLHKDIREHREDIQAHAAEDDKRFADINKRVDGVMHKIWFGGGFAAAIGAIAGIFLKGHQ